MSIQLNTEQEAAVSRILDFANGSESFFVLSGSAGTGKTSCVSHVIDRLEGRLSIALTATTNKATKVLRQLSGSPGVDCRTVYSLLGLRVTKNSEFKQVEALGESQASSYDLVVVDEGSMVTRRLLDYMQEAATECGIKFLFVGDSLQLPPVGESISPVFTSGFPGVKLTKVERHDNQILCIATHLREVILGNQRLALASDYDVETSEGVYCMGRRPFRNNMVAAFDSDTYRDHPGQFKVIAWRNNTTHAHNAAIRAALYGEERAKEFKFCVGEQVIAAASVAELSAPDEVLITTDEEALVTQVYVVEHPLFPSFNAYHLKLETPYQDGWVDAFVPHESTLPEYNARLEELREAALEKRGSWSAFYALKEDFFHDIRPSHSITAHRAQGSTYATAFVDAVDITSNRNWPEALACLYVACSRPSDKLIIQSR